jgi:hypothetical protein
MGVNEGSPSWEWVLLVTTVQLQPSHRCAESLSHAWVQCMMSGKYLGNIYPFLHTMATTAKRRRHPDLTFVPHDQHDPIF